MKCEIITTTITTTTRVLPIMTGIVFVPSSNLPSFGNHHRHHGHQHQHHHRHHLARIIVYRIIAIIIIGSFFARDKGIVNTCRILKQIWTTTFYAMDVFPNLASSSRFQYKIPPEREVAPPHKTLKALKSLSSDGWMGNGHYPKNDHHSHPDHDNHDDGLPDQHEN